MIKVKIGNVSINRFILGVLIWVLAFQSPLEEVNGVFSWLDEAAALLGIVCCFIYLIHSPKLHVSRNTFCIVVAMTVFVVVGLAGNILFQYQPLAAVALDLFTNLKFFCTIVAGYCLFGSVDWKNMRGFIADCARAITLILFCIFLLDRAFNFYPAQVRYGIKSAMLFFAHPTYLAGSMAFLLVLMTVSYEKKNGNDYDGIHIEKQSNCQCNGIYLSVRRVCSTQKRTEAAASDPAWRNLPGHWQSVDLFLLH